jgi:hypothetical protein
MGWKWTLGALLVAALATGCTKMKFNIDTPPRFTTASGNPPRMCREPDPAARGRENAALLSSVVDATHNACEPVQPCITGFDYVTRYEKLGDPAKPTEFAFQYIVLDIQENRFCSAKWSNMGSGPRLEYWPLPAFDMQASFRCAEGQINATVNAVVGVIDLDDLDSATANALRSLPAPSSNLATMISPLNVGNDVFNKVKAKVDDDHKITWSAKYQFDGCTRDAAGNPDPQTDCGAGQFSCLTVRWRDSVGGGTARFP